MRFLFVLLSILCIVSAMHAQQTTKYIKGNILDTSGNVVQQAHIYSSKFGNGSISNSEGVFNLRVSHNESSLVVSHVSFKKQKVRIPNRVKGDTIYLNIVLEVQNNYLGEVCINDKNKYLVVKPDKVWVYDYLLVGDDNMLVLLKDSTRFELRLINSTYGLIEQKTIEKGRRCSLTEDGLNRKYLCSNDSVYQIFINNEGLQWQLEAAQSTFENIVGPVVGGNEDWIFFEEFSLNNQMISYFGIHRKTHKNSLLTQILNIESFNNTSYIKGEIRKLQGVAINPIKHSYISKPDMEIVRNIFHWENYLNKVAGLPIYSPFLQHNNKIFIFDLVNGSMLTFNNEAENTDVKPIDFHKNKKVFSIEIDPITGVFYSLWLKNGITYVDIIDIENGVALTTFSLSSYPFPEKVKFRGGDIYFLYSDFNFNKKLFKMPVQQLLNKSVYATNN